MPCLSCEPGVNPGGRIYLDRQHEASTVQGGSCHAAESACSTTHACQRHLECPTSCWCSAAGESSQELAFWQQQHVTDSSLVSSVYLDGPELLSYNTR